MLGRLSRPAVPQWLDLSEGEGDQGYGKDALKAIVARKRRNDLVRNHEFEYLRQLRQRSPASSEAGPGETHLSFFQNSLLPRHDERELTLRKIDEIEAQMSRQWWQAAPTDATAKPADDQGESRLAPTTQPAETQGQGDGGPVTVTSEFAPTQMTDLELDIDLPGQTQPRSLRVGPGMLEAQAVTESDLDLEDAALRFASGDAAGAAAGLLAALRAPDDGEDARRGRQRLLALLDVYRMSGERESFERIGVEFSDRWGAITVPWEAESAGKQNTGQAGVADGAKALRVWRCPASLTAESVRELASIPHAEVVLDWGGLTMLSPEAWPGLERLVAHWCETPMLLRWGGSKNLSHVLRRLTVPNDRRIDPKVWALRLKVLCILGAHDEFDLVALEYCVTFNLPVPLWKPALCVCESLGATQVASVVAGGKPDGSEPTCELDGDLLGDVSARLEQLDAGREGGQRLTVSCASLGRVDLAAAGSLLNWLQARQAQASPVELRDVNAITAAFFRVLGIDEHARIVVRGV